MTTYNYSVGTLTETALTRSNYLTNETDSRDVYQFSTTSTSDINLSLSRISSGDDADLRLYRDNGNGYFDSGDQWITSSSASGNRDDAINARGDAGTYFAEVVRYSPGSTGTVNYNLALSATSPYSPSNLLPKEIDLGDLSSDTTRSGYISNYNTTDVYSFSLDFYEGTNISLTGLSADADIRLYQDNNNNGIVDTNELVRSSTSGGSSSEYISGIDLSGNYFLMVSQFGSSSTSYNLNFDHYTTTFA